MEIMLYKQKKNVEEIIRASVEQDQRSTIHVNRVLNREEKKYPTEKKKLMKQWAKLPNFDERHKLTDSRNLVNSRQDKFKETH